MVGQVDVLVEQACDVGILNGFYVPRRTCKASLGRLDVVDEHKCRNSFEVLNCDLAIEESEVWVNKVDVVGEKLTRLSAMIQCGREEISGSCCGNRKCRRPNCA